MEPGVIPVSRASRAARVMGGVTSANSSAGAPGRLSRVLSGKAASAACTHISAYLLKIEPDSAFGKHPPEGLPTGDEAADFYLYAVEQLEHHGYKQYEISNFAKPGYEGRHNLI